jgi:hypothetical protein
MGKLSSSVFPITSNRTGSDAGCLADERAAGKGDGNFATENTENTEKKGFGEKRGLDREDLALLFVIFAFFVAKMGPYFVWGRGRSPSPFILSPKERKSLMARWYFSVAGRAGPIAGIFKDAGNGKILSCPSPIG